MAATKIINVARDDRFQEVLDLFRQSVAEEVIFVLPKNAKAFNREANLAALRDVSQELGRRVSLLCPNPRVVALATAYGFDILQDSARDPVKKKKPSAHLALSDDDLQTVRDDSDAFEEDVVVPSDERVDLGSETEDAAEGMHEEDENLDNTSATIEEDAVSFDREPTSEELAGEELEADDIVAEPHTPTAVLTRAGVRRRLDGVAVPYSTAKNVRVPSSRESQDAVPVHRENSPRMDDIAAVWQSEQPQANMWADIPHETARPTFVSHTKSRLSMRLGMVAIACAVIGAGTFLYFGTGSANLTITPQSQDLELTLTANVADSIAEVDTALNKLPGQVFTVEKLVSQEFPASGEKDVAQKAKGTIAVSNTLSVSQSLVATTRFESSGGLIFRSLRSIVVPAGGKVNVEVIADKPGKEYNIEPGAFTIPAFKERADTERYQKITGTSAAAFTGGVNGKAKVVTEADYATARDTVAARAEQEATDAIRAEVGDLVTPKISVVVKGIESSAQVDQAADVFTLSGTGAVQTVAVTRAHLAALAVAVVERERNLVALPEHLEISLQNSQFSETTGGYTVEVSVRGKGYAKVDQEQIVQDLAGKSEADIRNYLKSAIGVASARVVLSPFWVTAMPENKEKVKFQIDYQE